MESKFVSAFLVDPDEKVIGLHDKVELMAGGEYIPGDYFFPSLSNLLVDDEELDGIALSRGAVAKPIGEVGKTSIGVMLCCEDMYPQLSRDMTNRGADLLVCLANGMCFDSEIALRQHFAIARFRVIENNRYFIRCGSHGVSGLITPTGRLLNSASCFEQADLQVAVPVEDRPLTVFTRFGDTLTMASYVLLIGFVATALVRRRTQVAVEGV